MISSQLLRTLSKTAPVTGRHYHSGISAFDRMLGDGLQSGQAIEWAGSYSCGKTGVLREVVRDARARGIAVAWVDTAHELIAADWLDDLPGRLWVIRPPGQDDALFCVEAVLRAQSFGVVILDSAPDLNPNRVVRLQRFARQAGAMLVMLGSSQSPMRGSKMHRRLHFDSKVIPNRSALARRGGFSWSLTVMNTRTAAPPTSQELSLVERLDAQRICTASGVDRSGGRTRVGKRYGR